MKIIDTCTAARKRGVSLIEGVLYLVIALAVIVGGIVYFQQAQLSNQMTSVSRASMLLSAQARDLYTPLNTTNSMNMTNVLLSAGVVPSDYQGPNDDIVHPFGGNIEVYGNDLGIGMVVTDLTEEACLRLAAVNEDGVGPLGTGIRGMMFYNDPNTFPTRFFDGDLSDMPGFVIAPIDAQAADSFCEDNIDFYVEFDR